MTLSGHNCVSIVELIFYIPTLIFSIIVCIRHGFSRSSGWIYTLLLCLVRIAGAICQLLTIHNADSSSLIQATIIISSIGLSPLLLATLAVLSRFVDFINAASTGNHTFTIRHFRLIQLVIIIGLILGIVGGTSGTYQPDGTFETPTESKAAAILYIVAYIGILGILLASLNKISTVPSKERRVPAAILLAMPFILVRLIYSICSVFLHSHDFNTINGSVIILMCMAVVEEFVVVAIYLILGFVVDKLNVHERGPIQTRGKNTARPPRHTQNELQGNSISNV